MTSKVKYNGDLRTLATHTRSGSTIETDAPPDNNGKGERFSPTDLVATALASCMVTVMGIKARDMGINIDGTECEIEKIMAASPRRISEIKVSIKFPKDSSYTDKEKQILENTANTCPVIQSLHPDCKKTVSFHWS